MVVRRLFECHYFNNKSEPFKNDGFWNVSIWYFFLWTFLFKLYSSMSWKLRSAIPLTDSLSLTAIITKLLWFKFNGDKMFCISKGEEQNFVSCVVQGSTITTSLSVNSVLLFWEIAYCVKLNVNIFSTGALRNLIKCDETWPNFNFYLIDKSYLNDQIS